MGAWRGGRRPVRILLAGDPGVGKTSLILSLVSEEFPEEVPSRAEEITIPADVTPEQVPTNIVDYNAVDQSDETLEYEIQRSHVVCVVYSVENEDSLDRVTSHWLPLIRECNQLDQRKPVVLVGNKVDLVDYSTIDHVLSIMEDFPEVESCVECSAKTLKNISEMFYYAQKAVLHPTSPLYVMENQDLTEGCKQALVRIFKVCDIDGDGLLNDYELNHFQRRCFNAPLQPQVLDEVKAVLQHNVPNGIEEDSVTLKGFLFLHILFIQRGRNETTWAVLRKFGYNENLEVSKEYLCPPLKVPSGSSTELSHRGQQFLCHIFERNDRDHDGALSPQELKCLFSACPEIPWTHDLSKTVPTNEMGWLTLHGWLCQWSLMTLIDVQKSLEYLAYLGFNIHENESQLTAVQVTREKRLDLAKKQSSRNVYVCHVIGPNGSGKSAFCQSFIQDDPQLPNSNNGNSSQQYCINTVQVYGQEKYLVLRDIEVRQVIDPLLPNEVNCDVACLLYDSCNPKSFEYIARIYIKYFAQSSIPVLIVATKSDMEEVRQDYILQPTEFCDKYKILPPQQFTTKYQYRDVYVKLATMAAFPRFQAAWILFYKHRFVQLCQQATHLKYFGLLPTEPMIWWKAGLGIAAATAFGYLVMKVFSGSKAR